MRHKRLNKRFGRSKSARKELIRTLARNTIIYQRIKTTLPKAREAARLVSRLISFGKEKTLQARRAAFCVLQDETLVSHLVKDIAPLFKDRNGGYTRIIQLNSRHGDGAQMAILELVEKIEPQKRKKEEEKKPEPPKRKKEEEKKPEPQKPEIKEEKKIEPPKREKEEEKKPEPQRRKEEEKKAEPKKEGLFGRLKGLFRKKP